VGRFELSQLAGAIAGGTLAMLVLRRFGTLAAMGGLLAGAVAGMLLATGLFVLIFWLFTRKR